jgi:hydrogenase-4 component B
LGLGAALALGAAVRLIGIGFLGRPRSLHAAGAEDARRGPLIGMGLLAVLMLPVALVPGQVLGALTPVVILLAPKADVHLLHYAPLPLLLLAFLIATAAGFVLHRFGVRGTREVAPWNGGFGRPPVWLPFGDPTTQPSATGFAEPVSRAITAGVLKPGADPADAWLIAPLLSLHLRGVRLAERIRRATIRERLAFVFGALVMFLLALGLVEGG